MVTQFTVTAIGYGNFFNKYTVEFDISVNTVEGWKHDTEFLDELRSRFLRKAKEVSACDRVELVGYQTHDD